MVDTIKLAESKPKNLAAWLHLAIEYFLFFRWIVFKNRPRGNFLLIRSFLVVGFQGGLFFWLFGDLELVLLGIEVDSVIALGVAVTIAFWNMSKSYQEKTRMCFAANREILSNYADGETQKAELLSTFFAINVLQMDFWAHQSFAWVFNNALEAAISLLPADEAHSYRQLRDKGALDQEAARMLLTKLQEAQLASVGCQAVLAAS